MYGLYFIKTSNVKTRRLYILAKITMIFMIFIAIVFMLNNSANAEVLETLENYTQVDLKANIISGYIGEDQHLVETISTISTSDGGCIVYLLIRDSDSHKTALYKYSKDGKLTSTYVFSKEVGTSGKFIKVDDMVVLVTSRSNPKKESRYTPYLVFIDNNGRVKNTYMNEEYTSSSINSNTAQIATYNNKVTIAVKNSANRCYYYEMSLDYFKGKEKFNIAEYSLNLIGSKDSYQIYGYSEIPLVVVYRKYSTSKSQYYLYFQDKKRDYINTSILQREDIWNNNDVPIINIDKMTSGKIIITSEKGKYVYNVNTRILSRYDDETEKELEESKILLNNNIQDEDIINDKDSIDANNNDIEVLDININNKDIYEEKEVDNKNNNEKIYKYDIKNSETIFNKALDFNNYTDKYLKIYGTKVVGEKVNNEKNIINSNDIYLKVGNVDIDGDIYSRIETYDYKLNMIDSMRLDKGTLLSSIKFCEYVYQDGKVKYLHMKINNYDIYIDDIGIIKKIENKNNYELIDNNDKYIVTMYKKNGNNIFNSLIYSKKDDSYRVKVNKINDEDVERKENCDIYIGTNKLKIAGRIITSRKSIKEDLKSNRVIKLSLVGQGINESQVIDLSFKNEFEMEIDNLKEGVYDDLVWEIEEIVDDDIDNRKFLAGEIPNGSEVYYNNILYIKLSDTLLLEKYSESTSSIVGFAYQGMTNESKKNFLTKAEVNKYESFIKDSNTFAYWLYDDGYAIGNKAYKGSAKYQEAYVRLKKEININEKFRYNMQDLRYYNNTLESKKVQNFSYNIKALFEVPAAPKIMVMPDTLGSHKESTKVDITASCAFSDLVLDVSVKKILEGKIQEFNKSIKVSNLINNTLSFVIDDSGYYEIQARCKNKYNNFSKTEEKIIRIDKDSPKIMNISSSEVKSDSLNNKYSKNMINTYRVEIEDISDVTVSISRNINEIENNKEDDNQEQYLEVEKIGIDKYIAMFDLERLEEVTLTILDEAGNITKTKFKDDYIVDIESPYDVEIIDTYDDNYGFITLSAHDKIGKIDKIYYEIIDEKNSIREIKKEDIIASNIYESTLKLDRKKYDRYTTIYALAVDYAGNISSITSKKLDMNSIVKLEVLDSDGKEIITKNDPIKFDLSTIKNFNLKISDDDINDDISIRVILKDSRQEKEDNNDYEMVLFQDSIDIRDKTEYIYEFSFNNESMESIIRKIDYDTIYDLVFEVSDRIEKCIKHVEVIKENMRPKMIVKTSKLSFCDYIELYVDVNDFDDSPYDRLNLKIYDEENIKIYEDILSNGLNKVIIKNRLKEGGHTLRFALLNVDEKVEIKKDILVKNNLDFNDNDINFISINESYSNEFYQMLYEKLSSVNNKDKEDNEDKKEELKEYIDIKKCIILDSYSDKKIDGIGDKIINIDMISILEDESYLKEVLKEGILKDKLLNVYNVKDKANTMKIIDKILNIIKTIDIKAFKTGENLELNQIEFFDYESDYLDMIKKRGVDRRLYMSYNSLDFQVDNNEKEISKEKVINRDDDKYTIKLDRSGRYALCINESDYIKNGDIDYSKRSDNKVTYIYAHKEPIVEVSYKEVDQFDSNDSNNYRKIVVSKKIYDEDFMSINKGISKLDVILKKYDYDGNLTCEIVDTYRYDKKLDKTYKNELEVEKDAMFSDDYYDIDLNYIYEIEYIGYDFGLGDQFDNKYIFSGKDKISINKINDIPECSFDYVLNDNNKIIRCDGYIYTLDLLENLAFSENIKYNDMFEKNKNLRSIKYDISLDNIKEEIKKGDIFSNNFNYIYTNALEVINNCGKTARSSNKKLEVRKIDIFNNTNEAYDDIVKGFKIGPSITLDLSVSNLKKADDIYLVVEGKRVDEDEVDKVQVCGRFKTTLDSRRVLKEAICQGADTYTYTYDVLIYSKRDNSYLGKRTYSLKLYNECEIESFEITKVYDKSIKLNMPVSINNMPIKNIKKGYAFDYDIITKNMNKASDKIKIDITYYYIKDNKKYKVNVCEIKDKKIEKLNTKIYMDKKEIGNIYEIVINDKINLGFMGDESHEVYQGTYFLPADSVFVYNNKILKKGEILVNFRIRGYRDNQVVYDYNKEKWISNSGDCAIYRDDKSVYDDFNEYSMY